MHCLVVATVVALVVSSMALISFFMLQEEQANNETYPANEPLLVLEEPEEIIKIPRRYTIGRREPGDKLVGWGSDSQQFRNETNAQVTVLWPAGPPNPNVFFTYADIYTNSTAEPFQSGMVLLRGNYSDNMIEFGVQANNTFLLEYKYELYALEDTAKKSSLFNLNH